MRETVGADPVQATGADATAPVRQGTPAGTLPGATDSSRLRCAHPFGQGAHVGAHLRQVGAQVAAHLGNLRAARRTYRYSMSGTRTASSRAAAPMMATASALTSARPPGRPRGGPLVPPVAPFRPPPAPGPWPRSPRPGPCPAPPHRDTATGQCRPGLGPVRRRRAGILWDLAGGRRRLHGVRRAAVRRRPPGAGQRALDARHAVTQYVKVAAHFGHVGSERVDLVAQALPLPLDLATQTRPCPSISRRRAAPLRTNHWHQHGQHRGHRSHRAEQHGNSVRHGNEHTVPGRYDKLACPQPTPRKRRRLGGFDEAVVGTIPASTT